MNRLIFRQVVTLSLLSAAAFAAPPRSASNKVDFQRQVRAILSDKCFQCHGPDEGTRMADLRLDTHEGALSKRDNGTTIVPGDLEASLFYQRITHKSEVLRMPPVYSKKELTVEQIDILRRWIEEGASWDQHWSFVPLEKQEPPQVDKASWVRNPLDRFILERLEQEGLEPAPEADKRTLARRVALDLTGLPPDQGVLESFLSDTSANAYEKLVDKLLASKHWGEHRGRYWLDAARYADTHGIHIDNYREMWAYRDWVIQAFNENKPFDEFAVEQIAGDLLPNPTLDQLVATGFQRCNMTTNEGGVIPEEYEVIYAKDRADTMGTVFLGLTVGCATCHDHKFDPIAQRDFYSLTAFFRNTTQFVMDGNVSDPPPVLVVPVEDDRDEWNELRAEATETDAALDRLRSSGDAVDAEFTAWLGSGDYRSVKAPLEESAEQLTLSLDGKPEIEIGGQRQDVSLHGGAAAGKGPDKDVPGLLFGEESWAELPSQELDSDSAFSIALWIFHPNDAGSFIVAGQNDPDDGSRGWTFEIAERQLIFKMTGDKVEGDGAEDEGGRSSVTIVPNNLRRLPAAEWTHITVTHDGSGEWAGLRFYTNGEIIPVQGSEYFTKVQGSIRADRPLMLAKGENRGRGGRDEIRTRYMSGGGIADLRIFNRVISVDEAKLVSQWAVLKRATEKQPDQLTSEERDALRLYFVTREHKGYRSLMSRKSEIELSWRELRRRGGVTHVMKEIQGHEPEAHILTRGMYDQRTELVKAGTPPALHPMAASLPRNRLGLAKWIVDDANPLTARVIVNRYWQQVFGNGIVRTSDDFGSQGETPSHPELLDWLAVEFRESGWDVKDFFRMMVTSSTYRQSSETTEAKADKDADNRLLSRGPRFRMDGEMVRDYALAASGLLVRKIGGPSVKPYQPEGVWESVAMLSSNTRHYTQDSGDKLYRRSMYTFWKRSAPPASMNIFNAPTREHSTVRRERTNTPLQALVTMNDPQFVEAVRHLAQKAIREAGDDFDRQLDYMSARLLARDFGEKERAVARRTYEAFVGYYGEHGQDAEKLLATGESAADEALPAAESAALTMVANQMINLDEVLNK